MKNLSESRDAFFRESVKAEYFAKVIGMIHQIDNEAARLRLVQGVLDSYLVQFHQDGSDPDYFNKLIELVNSVSSEEQKLALIDKLIDLHYRKPEFPAEQPAAAPAGSPGSAAVQTAPTEDDGRSRQA